MKMKRHHRGRETNRCTHADSLAAGILGDALVASGDRVLDHITSQAGANGRSSGARD